jgi:very-short-patch-repair endonuclease
MAQADGVDARRLARIARRQRGLFTRTDAAGCGFSLYQIRRRLAAGEWRPVTRSVLIAGGEGLSQSRLDLAAQLAVPGSVLAGISAAREWGLELDDHRTVLLVGPKQNVRLPGVRLLYGSVGRREIAMIDGARVTLRDRTVFDCLRLLSERRALDLLDRALQQGWVTLAGLGELAVRQPGQHGLPQVRRLLAMARGGERSVAERRLTDLLTRAGLNGWHANVPIVDHRGVIGIGDVVFEAERIVVEVDGWAYHVSPARFQHDRARQNRLVAAGWTVLRFTWRDLTDRPDRVIAALCEVVGGRSSG